MTCMFDLRGKSALILATLLLGCSSGDDSLANCKKDGGCSKVVDVLKVLKSQIFLNHDRGDQLIVLHDVDGCALASVGAMQRAYHRVLAKIICVARERAERHFQRREVLAIASVTIDL